MKKLIFLCALLIVSIHVGAQIRISEGHPTILAYGKSLDFKDADVDGSKYFEEKFDDVKVNKGEKDFPIRYNAYLDIMEFNNEGTIVELIKEENIHFKFSNGDLFELVPIVSKKIPINQYHHVLIDTNGVKLTKFSSIKFNKAKVAANSYESDTPANYKPAKDEYYIVFDNKAFPFDGKQKTLENLFPSSIDIIKAFYKQNKIKDANTDFEKLAVLFAKF